MEANDGQLPEDYEEPKIPIDPEEDPDMPNFNAMCEEK